MTVLFWGDINFPTSQAVDEEEEESDIENELFMQIEWSPKFLGEQTNSKGLFKSLNPSVLIFAIGPNASAFSETYLLDDNFETIGYLTTITPTALSKNKNIGNKDCIFLRQNKESNILFCHMQITLTPETHNDLVSIITSNVNLQNTAIIILTNLHYSNLKLDNTAIKLPCLRKLSTDIVKDTFNVCPYLEQPNVISGIAASIMTYSQIHKIPADLYIVYSEAFYTDYSTINAFQPLLTLKNISENINIQENDATTRKRLEQIINAKTSGYLFT